MSNPDAPLTSSFLDNPELFDAIYKFKNYARESEYLRTLINAVVPNARTLLDVACGTGEHAKFLKHHYAIDGIDINEHYLSAARLKNPSGIYVRADMIDFDLGRSYDVVTCLFSAIGIVRTFERLERAVMCMARHVKPAGMLIIEPWFAPERWRPAKPFVLVGELGSGPVYRFSNSVRQGQLSILMHNYLLCTRFGVEHYGERIELGLFTRDEMVWAFESAGMVAQYHSEGLMGRGLYVGRFGAKNPLWTECQWP
jgi:SAM-dependent methyltransferase